MTKEELLLKGISEEVADEIIAAYSDGDEDPLQLLNKALDSEPKDSLLKAEGGEEDEDDGEDEDEEDKYDEEYMKKYMKKYMSTNKKSCQKLMKEVGAMSGDMKKAIDDFDYDSDGAVVEMLDLAPILENQSEFNESMVKAMNNLAGAIDIIVSQNEKSFNLMQKAAKVTAIQAESLGDYMGQPMGRKGVTVSADMTKAVSMGPVVSKEQNQVIYKTLMKAVNSKDAEAGLIISAFESAGQDANRLNKAQKEYINNLLIGEAK